MIFTLSSLRDLTNWGVRAWIRAELGLGWGCWSPASFLKLLSTMSPDWRCPTSPAFLRAAFVFYPKYKPGTMEPSCHKLWHTRVGCAAVLELCSGQLGLQIPSTDEFSRQFQCLSALLSGTWFSPTLEPFLQVCVIPAYQINFVAMKEVQAIIHWQAVIQGVAEESDMTEHTCTHNVAAT